MSTKISILAIIVFLSGLSAEAQYRRYKTYELSLGIGTANVFGDLGGAAVRENWYGLKDIQFSQTRPLFYGAGRTYLNEQFSVKANLFAGMAAGKDAGSINDVRNYSYTAWMFEFSGQMEWNFWQPRTCIASFFAQRRGRRIAQLRTRMYLFAGAGVVYSSPNLDTKNSTLSEGEFTKTNTFGLAVPYGLGVRSDVNSLWAVGFEIGRRYCTSDYLDGITTNWSKSNDTYYFTTLHAIYKIELAGGKRRITRPPRR